MEPLPHHPSTHEILHDFSPRIRVYKDGHVERLISHSIVSPSNDPKTGIQSKDITITPDFSARIYLPSPENILEKTKLPLMIYFHGGAFCLFSASSSHIHNYLNHLISLRHFIVVSVDYRLAPEHPIPACYDDAWAAATWVAAHASGSGSGSGSGSDPWLVQWADFDRVYVSGESAGANIAHDVLSRAGPSGFLGLGVSVTGAVLVHPFFGDGKPDKLWSFLCPNTTGADDPRLNPARDPARLRERVGCKRVMVCVDKDDRLRMRGVRYYEALMESGWEGEVELVESNGGGHVFHTRNPKCDEAIKLMTKIASFINH